MLLAATKTPVWAAESPVSSFDSSTTLSNEGYFVLSWQSRPLSETTGALTLKQASSPEFSDSIDRLVEASGAITITGLEDGDYYFRLVSADGAASDQLQVSVAHHSLARAGGFFLLGLLLFSILIYTIVHGNRRID